MLPLFLLRWLGAVNVKRMPGVFGVFGERGVVGLDDMDNEDLVLKIGNCGGLGATRIGVGRD